MKSLFLLPLALGAASSAKPKPPKDQCRWAQDWTQDQILADTDGFTTQMLHWEGKFHQPDVAYNGGNGVSYDGSILDWHSGEAISTKPFSAASKEALQIMLYARAVEGSHDAAQFLSSRHPKKAPKIAFDIMEKKLETYLKFNETHPGFGGALPWFKADIQDIVPQPDWVNRVPALDNGELWWAVYAWIQALEKTNKKEYAKQAERWQEWLDFLTPNMLDIFYRDSGSICAVTTIGDQFLPVNHPNQTYECEGEGRLNDPYEGELVAFFFHLFGDLPQSEKDALWEVKRPQLVKDEYHQGNVGPVTVERGYWFSGHEPWKVLELPYYDVDIIRRLYHNHERVRTCNSVVTKNPGLLASVNNITDSETNEVLGYISPAGIPSIANQTEQYLEVVTPYASWPIIMFDRAVGLAWWHNMVSGKKMQNQYGSTESTRIDGEGVSGILTWDSKVLTVVSILGGVQDLVRDKLKQDGIYDEFIRIAEREYSMVFGDELEGEDVELCLPSVPITDAGLDDFTSCARK
ncbi:putative GPI anchored protein [Emericellopsis atlantica]|uniref:GPI anchored protein n=1 Tax=Emericellopsis atlantica TaxID=2614577 RepID=A0A9P7ZGE9_9HYPO|nr:putative GPI anchored protein [Emericellopsis atlantica]KAG9251090.1 putative GPI anchored protein [Emericellopsis atlantica]